MRITVDRGRDAVRLALSDAAAAETRALAEGIEAAYDAQGRLVGVTIGEVGRLSGAAEALAELRVDPSGGAALAVEVPAGVAAPRPPRVPGAPGPTPTLPPRALTPSELAALGPLTWDADAETALARVPFFQRGPTRLAVAALARERGLTHVTADLLAEARGRR